MASTDRNSPLYDEEPLDPLDEEEIEEEGLLDEDELDEVEALEFTDVFPGVV